MREKRGDAQADDAGFTADAVVPRTLFVLGFREELQALFIDQLGLGRDGVVLAARQVLRTGQTGRNEGERQTESADGGGC